MAANDTQEGKSQCGRDFNACKEAQIKPIEDISWGASLYLAVNVQDYENHQHPFPKGLVAAGSQVEILNIDGDGYGVYEITGVIGNTSGKTRTWTLKHKNSRGKPLGVASIKFFLAPLGRDEVYTKAEVDALLDEIRSTFTA